MEPTKEKTGKKAVLSPRCEEETGTPYDRAFSKRGARYGRSPLRPSSYPFQPVESPAFCRAKRRECFTLRIKPYRFAGMLPCLFQGILDEGGTDAFPGGFRAYHDQMDDHHFLGRGMAWPVYCFVFIRLVPVGNDAPQYFSILIIDIQCPSCQAFAASALVGYTPSRKTVKASCSFSCRKCF